MTWEEALARAKKRTREAFKELAGLVLWREYDLQAYMFKMMLEEGVLRQYVRREHRIWYSDKKKQLVVLDLALLDTETEDARYPFWPVREMIQLKYPVEFRSGLTEPSYLERERAIESSSHYLERCRKKILRETLIDYEKFARAVGKTANVLPSARCHIMYFDFSRLPTYSSSGELLEDLGKKGVDTHSIGSWPLQVTYTHAGSDSSRRR